MNKTNIICARPACSGEIHISDLKIGQICVVLPPTQPAFSNDVGVIKIQTDYYKEQVIKSILTHTKHTFLIVDSLADGYQIVADYLKNLA